MPSKTIILKNTFVHNKYVTRILICDSIIISWRHHFLPFTLITGIAQFFNNYTQQLKEITGKYVRGIDGVARVPFMIKKKLKHQQRIFNILDKYVCMYVKTCKECEK